MMKWSQQQAACSIILMNYVVSTTSCVFHNTDEVVSTTSCVFHNTDEVVSTISRVLHNTDEKVSTVNFVLSDTDEVVSAVNCVLHNTDEAVSNVGFMYMSPIVLTNWSQLQAPCSIILTPGPAWLTPKLIYVMHQLTAYEEERGSEAGLKGAVGTTRREKPSPLEI